MNYSPTNFEQVYKRNYPQMYRTAYCILQDAEEARDAVSQVFAQMWQNKPEVKEEALVSYLIIATRNQCLHTLRRWERDEEMSTELRHELHQPNDHRQEELIQQVQRVIRDNLTEQDRRVIALHFDQELTYKETAQTLGISSAAVNKHITQALAKLRNILNPSNK